MSGMSDWYHVRVVFKDSKSEPIDGPASEDKAAAQADLAKFDAAIDKPGAKVQGVEWYSGYGREIRAAHIVTQGF